jgi:hypothetical protein
MLKIVATEGTEITEGVLWSLPFLTLEASADGRTAWKNSVSSVPSVAKVFP